MRTTLGLRMRITVALAVTAAATALFAVLGAMWIIAGIIDRADQRELRSHYDALQSRIAEESHRAAAMSAVVAAMPATQEAMAKQDREALVRLFGPVFAAIKSDYGVDQFQFHVPPATSFLRVHQPAKFGDDLSGFRKTVVVANQERRVVVGLEGGVAGLGIRGVVPIAQTGKHLGSVEFGLTFGQPFLDDFKTNRHVDVAFHLSDGGSFKLFGGTLKGKSFFDAAEYGRATAGQHHGAAGQAGGHAGRRAARTDQGLFRQAARRGRTGDGQCRLRGLRRPRLVAFDRRSPRSGSCSRPSSAI